MTNATEVTLAIPNTKALAADQKDVVELAEAFVVDSQLSLENATDLAKCCKANMKTVDELLGGIVKKSNDAHVAAKGVWNKFTKPNQKAYDIYREKMGDYVYEQERKALAERQRKAAEARRVEEKRIADEAEQLAEDDRLEEAVALVDKPIVVAVAEPVKTKAKGMSTRTEWKFRVVDKSKIPLAYMNVNEVLIGQTVRQQHEAAADLIPGIQVYADTGVSIRS